MNTKIWGYARVSTKEQNLDRQIEELIKFGVEERNIFIDKQSGKDFNREAYKSLINYSLREGDLLVVKSIDRFGRNYQQILNKWKRITKSIRADILVLDMPILDTRKDKDLLGMLITDIVLQLLSYVSENERNTIKQRQAEGIAIAKARGKYLGRPKITKPENWNEHYTKWKNGEITAVECMKRLNLKKDTFYKFVKNFNNK